jgi:hypothetical protein
LVSAAGCDSVATLHLIVNPNLTGQQTITICQGQLPYTWNGQTINAGGDYNATLVSATGCDSVATLHLIVNPNVAGQQTITICQGQLPYSWNSQSITAAGNYNATLVSAAGCDSVATLHLIVNPNVTGQQLSLSARHNCLTVGIIRISQLPAIIMQHWLVLRL